MLEDTTIQGARGILINITGDQDMTLHEVSTASKIVQEAAHPMPTLSSDQSSMRI